MERGGAGPAPAAAPAPQHGSGQEIVVGLLQEMGDAGLGLVSAQRIAQLEQTDALSAALAGASPPLGQLGPEPGFLEAVQALGAARGKAGSGAVGAALQQCVALSRQMDGLQAELRLAVEGAVGTPFAVLANTPRAADLRGDLEQSLKHYDKMKAKARGTPERRQAAVNTQAAVLSNSVCDYANQLSLLQEKRDVELVRHIFSVYQQLGACVQAMAQCVEAEMPAFEDAVAEMEAEQADILHRRQQLAAFKALREKEVFRSERHEADIERHEREAKDARKSDRKHKARPGVGSQLAGSGPAIKAYLLEVFAAAGNICCADCGAAPAYVACDYGMLLCRDCAKLQADAVKLPMVAGVPSHRFHIRSLEAADLRVEDLRMLKAIGNVEGNNVFEKRLSAIPPALQATIKPNPQSTVDEKAVFIRKKYVDREFVVSQNHETLLRAFRDGSLEGKGAAAVLLQAMAEKGFVAPDLAEALHLSVAEGSVAAVDFLLQNGCDPNLTLQSYTPLHVAAQMNQVDVAKVLLYRGADKHVQDPTGMTPIQIAHNTNSTGVLGVFQVGKEGQRAVDSNPAPLSPPASHTRPAPTPATAAVVAVAAASRPTEPLYAELSKPQPADSPPLPPRAFPMAARPAEEAPGPSPTPATPAAPAATPVPMAHRKAPLPPTSVVPVTKSLRSPPPRPKPPGAQAMATRKRASSSSSSVTSDNSFGGSIAPPPKPPSALKPSKSLGKQRRQPSGPLVVEGPSASAVPLAHGQAPPPPQAQQAAPDAAGPARLPLRAHSPGTPSRPPPPNTSARALSRSASLSTPNRGGDSSRPRFPQRPPPPGPGTPTSASGAPRLPARNTPPAAAAAMAAASAPLAAATTTAVPVAQPATPGLGVAAPSGLSQKPSRKKKAPPPPASPSRPPASVTSPRGSRSRAPAPPAESRSSLPPLEEAAAQPAPTPAAVKVENPYDTVVDEPPADGGDEPLPPLPAHSPPAEAVEGLGERGAAAPKPAVHVAPVVSQYGFPDDPDEAEEPSTPCSPLGDLASNNVLERLPNAISLLLTTSDTDLMDGKE